MLIGIDANEANVENKVGSNEFASQILWQISQLDRQNRYQIFLKNPPAGDLPQAVGHWRYRVLRPGWFWTQWRLPLALYKTPNLKAFLSLTHYAPRFCPVPRIVTILDLAFLKFPDQFLKTDLVKLTRWTSYSVKKARHILTISRASKNDLVEHFGLAPQDITVVYPGINHKRFTRKISPRKLTKVMTRYGISQPYLLYLGALQPRKNLLALIKAFSKRSDLLERRSDLKGLQLVIAGKKGWLYRDLFKTVKTLKLSHKVIFTGYLPAADVPALIKGAKLFIYPSLYEGFGIPVVQAMAAGTPVLVAKNSSLTEIVQDAGSYIRPPFKAKQVRQGIIEALFLPQEVLSRRLVQAKKRAFDFDWRQSGKKVVEVLNEFSL